MGVDGTILHLWVASSKYYAHLFLETAGSDLVYYFGLLVSTESRLMLWLSSRYGANYCCRHHGAHPSFECRGSWRARSRGPAESSDSGPGMLEVHRHVLS